MMEILSLVTQHSILSSFRSWHLHLMMPGIGLKNLAVDLPVLAMLVRCGK